MPHAFMRDLLFQHVKERLIFLVQRYDSIEAIARASTKTQENVLLRNYHMLIISTLQSAYKLFIVFFTVQNKKNVRLTTANRTLSNVNRILIEYQSNSLTYLTTQTWKKASFA